MISKLLAPKWQEFHQSLASMLNLTVRIVDEQGRVAASFNARPPFTYTDNPGLAADWAELFQFFLSHSQGLCIERCPLGFLHASIPLDNNCLLVISGGLEWEKPGAEKDFTAAIHKYGLSLQLADYVPQWSSLEEIRAKASSVQTLYKRIIHSINESSNLGQEAVLLAALDEISNLMVGLLSPDTFDLSRIVDLVASSLVILLNAQGAWVYTHCQAQCETVTRGVRSVLIKEAAQAWADAAIADADPILAASSVLENSESVYPFSFRMTGSVLYLGVIAPEEDNIDSILSAFGKQVAIAMEMDSLYSIMQRRIGELLNSIRHGVIITNKDGLVMVVSRAARKILGDIERAPIIGAPLSRMELGPELEKAVIGATQGASYFRKQSMLDYGEDSIHLNWDSSPLIGNNGEIAGAIIVFEDITEMMALTRQLREWERLATAGEVAAGLAHEIRNPLAAARGALQLFDMVKTDDQRRELLARFSGELDRMNSILSEYLTLTKSPGGEELQPISLTEIISDIRFLIKSEALLYNVELLIPPCRPGLPMVSASSSSLKQVFLNIAKNSIEAMTDGGTLTILLDWDRTHAWVEFKDNGPGIPPEHLANIFRPFFTTKVGGTGLGLAISQRIIKRMDGEIKIKSVPGFGTVVSVYLPALQ